jgi:hypothetical protein
MSEEDGFQSERKQLKLIQDRLSACEAASLKFESEFLALRQRLPWLDEYFNSVEAEEERMRENQATMSVKDPLPGTNLSETPAADADAKLQAILDKYYLRIVENPSARR